MESNCNCLDNLRTAAVDRFRLVIVVVVVAVAEDTVVKLADTDWMSLVAD